MHGDGSYIRSWLHVRDAVRAIITVIEKGQPCSIYNACGYTELPNIEVLRRIAHILRVPESEAFIAVPNRVGQDLRYSMDDGAIRALGWTPEIDFEGGLRETVHEFDRTRFIMP
jgi:dTDP-D-glucose 4,6-dehydratase